jgi:PAP2 superfamily
LLDNFEKQYNFFDWVIGIFCFCLAFGICWSRISLGSHSWDQVLIGALIGILSIIMINFEFIDKFLINSFKSGRLILWTIIMSVCHFAYSIIMNFVNEPRIRDNTAFINRVECPNCIAKILKEQATNHAQVMILLGITLGISMNYSYTPDKISEEIRKELVSQS